MTWFDDESGVETSRPREVYLFEFPVASYRIAAGDEDVEVDGHTYRGSPREMQVSRDEVSVAQASSATRELIITIPVAHAIAQRYLRNAQPPLNLRVTVLRKQLPSGIAEQIWSGDVVAAEVEEHVLKLTVPSLLAETLARRMPVFVVGRQCPHVLYDANCRADSLSKTVNTSIVSVEGTVVTVASVGGNPDDWFEFGDLRHPATGEVLEIESQVGNVLTLQLPLVDAAPLDAVVLRPGCTHDISICQTKFNNRANYGGGPATPFSNPHVSKSKLGVVTQT
jgi:uncharacterized phage protein (TIGR02218 family)